jgi:hypothetical protein
MADPVVPPTAAVLPALRGLRSAPLLAEHQRQELRAALKDSLAGCEWFTLGVMAPSVPAAVAALRACERAQGWPALQEQLPAIESHEAPTGGNASSGRDDSSTGAAEPEGPVFLKGNQRNGTYLLRSESGLGEGILITGHNPADPSRQDTWGPLPLDLFDGGGTADS